MISLSISFLRSIFLSSIAIFLLPSTLLFLYLVVLYWWDSKGFRKYPIQNILSGITPLGRGWEIMTKTRKTHTQRHHDALKTNPVIRIGPNWLSFGRAQAATDIYGYKSKCVKATPYDLLADGGSNLNNISDKPTHSIRRRMVASSYAPKNIPDWEPMVYDSVSMLIEQLRLRCTQRLIRGNVPESDDLTWDGVYWIFLYSVETVIKIMVGKKPHFLHRASDLVEIQHRGQEKKVVSMIGSIHSVQRSASTIIWDTTNFKLWTKLSKAFSSNYATNFQGGDDHEQAMKMLVEERLERYNQGEHVNDLFEPMIMDKLGNESDISFKDRVAEVQQGIGAGSDGPAVSITMTLYFLVKNPDKIHKLRAELDSVLTESDKIAPWSKVGTLPYLRACIDEAMRLIPPVATDLIRRTPPQGAVIDGEVVPGDTNVSIAAYTSHRDPALFPDPEEYIPERWMQRGTQQLKDMLSVYIPFSAGTRGCIGRNVSILMQTTCIATMIYWFEFALPHPSWEMQYEEWFNLWPLAMPMKIWEREFSKS